MSLSSIQAKLNKRMKIKENMGLNSSIVIPPSLSTSERSFSSYRHEKFTDYCKAKAKYANPGRAKFPGKDLF